MAWKAEIAVYRSLRRVLRRLGSAPLLWDAIHNGVVRRTGTSRDLADLQKHSREGELDLAEYFRRRGGWVGAATSGGDGAGSVPCEHRLGLTIIAAARPLDAAFASLRNLHVLDGALTKLERSGAFSPVSRTPAVRYLVGQRLNHHHFGPCVVYGWDARCDAVEPASAGELNGYGPIVDNRQCYVGIDDAARDQPYYRVLLADGVGRLCAQSLLSPEEAGNPFDVPLGGSSFFFVGVHRNSGCFLPRPELARRYPDDVALMKSLSCGS